MILAPAQAITIFSPVLEMSAKPGQTQKGLLKLYNETGSDLVLTANLQTFSADHDGQLKFFPLTAQDNFLRWFVLSQDNILIKAKQAMMIPFAVSVPASAVPGGYNAVIFWSEKKDPANNQSTVNISSQVGTLIFFKVAGDFKESGEITDFFVSPVKKIFFGWPDKFLVQFENNGNIYLKPQAKIIIKNWFGQEKSLAAANGEMIVLPQTNRRFETSLRSSSQQNFFEKAIEESKFLALGPCQATLNFDFGENNKQHLTRQIDLFIIPIHLLIVLFGFGLGLMVLFKINYHVNKIKKGIKPSGVDEKSK